ncbi:nickel pincer cofactor biosynthesis protein LarC [Lachnospiraceae bacterium ZAX-1]
MKQLYIECNMGAAGDMLMGALFELLDTQKQTDFLEKMNTLPLSDISLTTDRVQKCGIYGTKMNVFFKGKIEEHSNEGELHTHAHSHAHEGEPHTHAYSHEKELQHSHFHEGELHTHSHEEELHTHSHVHEEENHTHAHSHKEEPHSHEMELHSHSHEEIPHSHTHEREPHTHAHGSYLDILAITQKLAIPEQVKANFCAVYKLIGNAEAKAHHTDLDHIHFHEVGTMDAIADVLGCCLLFHELQADFITVSPIHVGSGTVHCAHGILPVPAPAVVEILQGTPIYSSNIQGELCTPTGAAILKHFANKFSPMPDMILEKAGYGMGTKNFPIANCVRTFYGTASSRIDVPSIKESYTEGSNQKEPHILEISCNLDDMTPEAIAYTMDLLLEQGALDVFCTPTTMKKSRPGILLTCLCPIKDEPTIGNLLLAHTTTRGIRIKECRRQTLHCEFETVSTIYGTIPIKISSGYGITKYKPEYEDVAKAAKQYHLPFQTIYEEALKTFQKQFN